MAVGGHFLQVQVNWDVKFYKVGGREKSGEEEGWRELEAAGCSEDRPKSSSKGRTYKIIIRLEMKSDITIVLDMSFNHVINFSPFIQSPTLQNFILPI